MSFILSSNKIRGVRYTDNPNPITGENIVTKLPELYDSTTDTGYYGIKTSAQIMSGTQLATAMGITEGTSQK